MASEALPSGAPSERVHGRRLFVIWTALTVAGVLLIVFVAGPHMPPGNFSKEARDQRHINILLAALAVPVLFGVWTCLVYIFSTFRQGEGELQDGPPVRGHLEHRGVLPLAAVLDEVRDPVRVRRVAVGGHRLERETSAARRGRGLHGARSGREEVHDVERDEHDRERRGASNGEGLRTY